MLPLIDCHTLQQLKEAVLLDCRFVLGQPDTGRQDYQSGHLPGAYYADLERHLSSPIAAGTGRHPLPSPDALRQQLGHWGIRPETPVVVYDDSGGAFAARAWWLLRWLGHRSVAVLDGGLAAWIALGKPLDTAEPAPAAAGPYPREDLDRDSTVDNTEVLANIASTDFKLIDARAVARFRGESEPIDPVAGHVPGAVCRPLGENLDTHGHFKPREQLRAEWLALLDGEPCVTMCGSGVTACHHLLALEIAGLPAGRLYPGSWSEWITDPTRPIAKGA